jgi:predicted phage terminase large subunit-like protein
MPSSFAVLSLADQLALYRATVENNPWLRHHPHPRQANFLAYWGLEALYGGAAAGGKSEALLMAALQFADVPGYSALLLRRSYSDLALPGALMDRAQEWLRGTKARWADKEKTWHFPSGATLTFGYLDTSNDRYRYASAEFQFVGFDELSQFEEQDYRFLFSRLRRLQSSSKLPLRMRAGSNPGGRGHDWVKKRFLTHREEGLEFVPAKLEDNPSVDQREYTASLSQLDPITRAQLLAGDWDAYLGGRFRKEWFRTYRWTPRGPHLDGRDAVPLSTVWAFITCDPALTAEETTRRGIDADYTAIGVWGVTRARDLFVVDVVRKRLAPDEIIPEIVRLCVRWGARGLPISYVGIEDVAFQELLILQAKRAPGMPAVRGLTPGGKKKLDRALPAIIRAEQGGIYLPSQGPEHPWVEDFVAEVVQFTGDDKMDAHDDQVDILSYACCELDRFGLNSSPDPDMYKDIPAAPSPYRRQEQRQQQGGAAHSRGLYGLEGDDDDDN